MPRTVVGPDTKVGGPLSGKDEIVIEGTVDGSVTGEGSVTIASGARVGGEVRARDVVIGGSIHHSVHATQTIHVLATAEVFGDLHAPRIAIDDGALCEGALRMGRKTRESRPAVEPASEPARASAADPTSAAEEGDPSHRPIPVLPGIGKRRLVRR